MTAIQSTKIRTNVYLDADMKEQAKNIFKKYGVSLSISLEYVGFSDGVMFYRSRVSF